MIRFINWCPLKLTIVWKHEWRLTRNGGFSGSASTRFSVIVHSTSSSCMITSFFNIFIANSSFVVLCSPSKTLNKNNSDQMSNNTVQHTFPNDPLPSTVRNVKSDALITSHCCCWADVVVDDDRWSASADRRWCCCESLFAYDVNSSMRLRNRSISASSSGGIGIL